jgi:hypothetical protein
MPPLCRYAILAGSQNLGGNLAKYVPNTNNTIFQALNTTVSDGITLIRELKLLCSRRIQQPIDINTELHQHSFRPKDQLSHTYTAFQVCGCICTGAIKREPERGTGSGNTAVTPP